MTKQASLRVLIPALAVASFAAMIPEGGYAPTHWYPLAIFLVGLLGIAVVARPVTAPIPRAAAAATLLLCAYAGWSYLSIEWAGNRGDAWDGANRTALYAAVYALFALWPVRARLAAVLLGAFGLAAAVAGLAVLLQADAASDPLRFFVDARLSEPVGYPNGAVALWTMGLWPCVFLASRREVNPLLRGLFLASSGLLLGLALMGQSRAWFLLAPIALVVYVALVPGRARIVAVLLPLGIAAAAFAAPVLDVYGALEPGADPAAVVGDAVRPLLIASAALFLVGVIGAAADRRLTAPAPRSRRALGPRARRVAVAVAAVGVLGLVAGALATGQPADEVSGRWSEFKQGQAERRDPGRLTSGGSNRYDFWRVALDRFAERPVAGIGVDNFQQDYLERRRSDEEPRYPHSLPLRALLQTGALGALLLAAALAAALVPAVRGARAGTGLGAGCAAVGTAVFAYWALHGTVDWFWEIPALGAPAFAMLGLAGAIGRTPGGGGAGRRYPRLLAEGPWQVALALVASLLVASSFALPWLSHRYVNRAAKVARFDEVEVRAKLDRARRLNPLSSRPEIYQATIAVNHGRFDEAAGLFDAALERDPRNWFATFELGAIRGEQRRFPEAVALLERASRLSPRDEIGRRALESARRGRPLRVADLNRAIIERTLRRYVFDPRGSG